MSTGNTAKDRGLKTRELFLEALANTGMINDGCLIAGVTRSAYEKWRQRIPDFAVKADAIRMKALESTGKEIVPDRSFQSFRNEYFNHTSPWFHLKAIEAYENTPPGNITLILWPPEHGKTTLAEDYFCYKLAINPEFRITVGSEGQDMARKILGRIRTRMERSVGRNRKPNFETNSPPISSKTKHPFPATDEKEHPSWTQGLRERVAGRTIKC